MEQPAADRPPYSIVRQIRRMLANMNFYLTRDSRILEFGCGAGNAVYEFRDAGFDAYGFEIRPSAKLRRPEDAHYFRFALTGKPANVPEYAIDQSFKIPFDDEFFDCVYSNSTFEHVMDYDMALAENARVLKPGGIAIHTFPSRYVPIEPHIYVPFGGAVQQYLWYLLWASLGIRNEYQRHMGPVECAKNNLYYARTGLNYLPTREILKIAARHFRQATPVPHLWELGDDAYLSRRGKLIFGLPGLRWLYNRCCTVVLWLRK